MRTILLAFLVLALVGCQAATPSLLDRVPHTSNELIYNDVLLAPFTSKNVTVLGVSVGMSEADVQAKIGAADHVDEFNFGAQKNWEYSTSLRLNSTGVLYHFESGTLTRILVTSAMNKYLHGASVVNKTKSDIYGLHGAPERQYDLPHSQRFFVYNKLGLEEYLDQGVEYQYAFVYPMRKLPSTAFINKTIVNDQVLQVELPRLLTDTTTLCDQGLTYAMSPSTKECKQYTSSCVIPDTWVEVDSCTNSTT